MNHGPGFARLIPHRFAACVAGLLGLVGGCGMFNPPLTTVDAVDLDRYAGRWYEIARYPNTFEAGCAGVTAEYTPRADGRIEVLNTCLQGSLDGPARTIEGSARVFDTETNARLKVTFFWPFEADYWIVELDEEYEWAVVSEPGRRFLWILSRRSTLDEELYGMLLDRVQALGFDVNRLELVPQAGESGT